MKIKLSDYPTFNKEWKKEETVSKTEKMLIRIGGLQNKMYAQNKYSILIIFQGMDASGKDGLTISLLKNCNPIGFEVNSFKKPTEEEYAHDFLWRIHNISP
ncbi:MAG: polyphosphate kinase, partial [Bacteroidia bacterium]|nr:polyphosphate kinase [Bacteroidia bacterium]